MAVRSDKSRVVITLSEEALKRLEKVNSKYGVSKSVQIQNLIYKYLECEYQLKDDKMLTY